MQECFPYVVSVICVIIFSHKKRQHLHFLQTSLNSRHIRSPPPPTTQDPAITKKTFITRL